MHLLLLCIVVSGGITDSSPIPQASQIEQEAVSKQTRAPNQAEPNQQESAVETDTVSASANGMEAKRAYKELYEETTQSQERLISTMRWAIGIVTTLFTALIGAIIYFNYQISQREVEAIKSNMKKELSEKQTEWFDKLSKEVKSEMKRSKKELSSKISNDIDTAVSELERKETIMEGKLDSIENRIEVVRSDIQQNDARLWKIEGVEANALNSYIESAKHLLEADRSTEYILDDISDTIDQMDDISRTVKGKLTSLLADLPEEVEGKVSTLRKKLDNLNEYTLPMSRYERQNPLTSLIQKPGIGPPPLGD